jgi:electron transport complex protein RnfB
MEHDAYRQLAARLDTLPNGFPPTEDGLELAILARLYTLEEAALAAQLRLTPETPDEIAARIGGDAGEIRNLLKGMARRGLIEARKTDDGLRYALMPFVVGIYEMQLERLDAELARLTEEYMKRGFESLLLVEPQFHRVIPIGESIPVEIDVHPFESAAGIVQRAQAWGVVDCICRKQKALVGEACEHPVDICMVFSDVPGAFDRASSVKALTREESLATLRRAADAGLVHTVGNYQDHTGYICNCCTCSCGILRGVAELGMSNVVARSAFVSQVDDDLCIGCEDCIPHCQFDALTLDQAGIIAVNRRRCVGCGQCVLHCSQEALSMVRRPESEVKPVPATLRDWQTARAAARGIDLADIL